MLLWMIPLIFQEKMCTQNISIESENAWKSIISRVSNWMKEWLLHGSDDGWLCFTSYSNLQCTCVLIDQLQSSTAQDQVPSEALEAARLDDPRPSSKESGAIPKSKRTTPAGPIAGGRKAEGKYSLNHSWETTLHNKMIRHSSHIDRVPVIQ